MEEAILRAISGGYVPKYEKATVLHSTISFTDDGSILLTGEHGKILEIYDKEKVLLDKDFWQCLGNAEGWAKNMCLCCHMSCQITFLEDSDCCNDKVDDGWKLHALRFHEINLTQGFDKAVEWLEELIKS